jgi:hypothetical protein
MERSDGMLIFLMVYLMIGMAIDLIFVSDEEIARRGITSPAGILAVHAGLVIVMPITMLYTAVKIIAEIFTGRGRE